MDFDISQGSNRSFSSEANEHFTAPNSSHNSFNNNNNNHHSNSSLSANSFQQDFIVICQPSELEGPLPIHVIPETPRSKFNIGKFAVRLHSMEYTAKYPIGEAYNEFVPKDVQVVLTEPSEKAVVFVYYFGLHDYIARGYTRFFSISYITRTLDSKKIMSHFESLTQQFEKVVNIFRTSNRQFFARELEHRKADLEFTKQDLQSSSNHEEEEDEDPFEESSKPPTPKKCDRALEELEDIIQKFKSANSEQVSSLFTGPREGFTPKVLKNTHRDTYIDLQLPLRGLAEICSEQAFQKAITKMKKILKHFSRPPIVLALEQEDHAILEPISSLLTVGHIVMSNFHPNADMRRQPQSKNRQEGSFTLDHPKFERSTSEDDDSTEYHTPEEGSKHIEPKLIEQKLDQFRKKTTFVVPLNKEESDMTSSASYGSLSTGSLNMLSQTLPLHYLNKKNFNIESFAASLWGFSKHKWGFGFLDLREKYIFSKHLLFSILKGRPVVIYAKQNRELYHDFFSCLQKKK